MMKTHAILHEVVFRFCLNLVSFGLSEGFVMETQATLKTSICLIVTLIIVCLLAKVTEFEIFAWMAIVLAVWLFLNLYCLAIYCLKYLHDKEKEDSDKKKRRFPREIKLTFFETTLCIKIYRHKEKITWN